MADKIVVKDILDYKVDIIIREAPDKPHKMLVLNMHVTNQLLGGLQGHHSFRVLDSVGKIRYTGDHLNLAVNAYNKLYNEDNSR